MNSKKTQNKKAVRSVSNATMLILTAVIVILGIMIIVVKSKNKDKQTGADAGTISTVTTPTLVTTPPPTTTVTTVTEPAPVYVPTITNKGGATYVDGVLVVNKSYPLSNTYQPQNDNAAINELIESAKNDGVSLDIGLGYVSYNKQKIKYHAMQIMTERGDAGVSEVERPGFSEHQSGLAYDILSDGRSIANNIPAQDWLDKNASKFGFIIRYPKGKETITGYEYEPGHIRYVGKEFAKTLNETGLTIEEYFGITSVYAQKDYVYKPEITVVDGLSYVDGILLANKTYSLPSSYNIGVDSTAGAAVDELIQASANDGINLFVCSGFRSYLTQKNLYQSYVNRDGQAAADTYSARPGYSEHQTGLAFDMNNASSSFNNTKEAKWLAENCYKYGFIIRYPQGKESITGYQYESWHIRYVGTDLAKAIHDTDLTLEEFFGITSRYAD